MQKENYQKILDETIAMLQRTGKRPRLLLHSCCAPCSSYVLQYLTAYFDITVFYYNPNIAPESEFRFRADEQQRLLDEMCGTLSIPLVLGEYDPTTFLAVARGLEHEPEGGMRCRACYRLRLEQAAATAKAGGFDYFTTTLTISPHKDAQALNQIGSELAQAYGVAYLFSDFKKKNGYRTSCLLSQMYGLYRQDYCGCPYSRLEAEQRRLRQMAEPQTT